MLADFGMSAILGGNQSALLLSSVCGTPYYTPPEVHQGNRYDGFASDIWSLGIILYSLLYHRPPFQGNPQLSNYKYVCDPSISEGAIEVIEQMMCVNIEERGKSQDILQHEWLTEDAELTRRIALIGGTHFESGV